MGDNDRLEQSCNDQVETQILPAVDESIAALVLGKPDAMEQGDKALALDGVRSAMRCGAITLNGFLPSTGPRSLQVLEGRFEVHEASPAQAEIIKRYMRAHVEFERLVGQETEHFVTVDAVLTYMHDVRAMRQTGLVHDPENLALYQPPEIVKAVTDLCASRPDAFAAGSDKKLLRSRRRDPLGSAWAVIRRYDHIQSSILPTACARYGYQGPFNKSFLHRAAWNKDSESYINDWFMRFDSARSGFPDSPQKEIGSLLQNLTTYDRRKLPLVTDALNRGPLKLELTGTLMRRAATDMEFLRMYNRGRNLAPLRIDGWPARILLRDVLANDVIPKGMKAYGLHMTSVVTSGVRHYNSSLRSIRDEPVPEDAASLVAMTAHLAQDAFLLKSILPVEEAIAAARQIGYTECVELVDRCQSWCIQANEEVDEEILVSLIVGCPQVSRLRERLEEYFTIRTSLRSESESNLDVQEWMIDEAALAETLEGGRGRLMWLAAASGRQQVTTRKIAARFDMAETGQTEVMYEDVETADMLGRTLSCYEAAAVKMAFGIDSGYRYDYLCIILKVEDLEQYVHDKLLPVLRTKLHLMLA